MKSPAITALIEANAALIAALKAEQIKTAAAYGLSHPKK